MGKSKGFIILTITNILSKIISLLYIPFLIHNIGEIGYGNYYAAYNVFTFVYMITIAGASNAIPKLISEYRETENHSDAIATFKIGTFILVIMGVFFAITLFILGNPLADFVGYQESYLGLIALCPAILLTALGSAYRGYFQGNHDLKPLGISQFIEQVLNVIFSLFFSYILMKKSLALGIAGGTIGTSIGALGSLIYLHFKYIKYDKGDIKAQRRHSDKYIFTYIIRYSIPLLISTAFIYAGNNVIDVANIHRGLLKAGFNQELITIKYAYFGNYMQIINVPMILISSLAVSFLPIIAKENASKDKARLSFAVNKLIKIGFLIGIPAAVGLSILSKEVFTVIFNRKIGGAEIMTYGAYVFIFSSVYQLTNTILNSLGKVKAGAISAFIGVVIKITFNFLLIPIAFINILGVVIGLLVSNLITMLINIYIIEKEIGEKGILKGKISKILISSLIMGIIIFIVSKVFQLVMINILGRYFTNLIALIISIYLGAIIYFNILINIGALDEGELNLIPNRFKKILFIKS
ncbi:MAG: putative polysaccharide biosynthesis protein [Sarcina sp.]